MMPRDIASHASVGFVSWLRTGNVVVDMLIAMMIPCLFTYFTQGGGRIAVTNVARRLRKLLVGTGDQECIRTIAFHRTTNGPHNFDTRNELLQKALTLYFAEGMRLQFHGPAQVALTALNDQRFVHHYERPDKHNPMANYRLTWIAPEGQWVDVDPDKQIEFRMYTNTQPSDDSNQGSANKVREQVIYELKCNASHDASTRIDALIEEAVAWYKTELLKSRDDSRYLYTMNIQEKFSLGSDSKDDDAYKYKR